MRAVFDVPRPPWGPRAAVVGPSGAVGQFRWHPTLDRVDPESAPVIPSAPSSITTEAGDMITTEAGDVLTTED